MSEHSRSSEEKRTAGLAQRIHSDALSHAAGRVTFRTESGFEFAPTDKPSIQRVLLERSPKHYKLQRKKEARWRDISRYRRIGDAKDVTRAFAAGSLKSFAPHDIIRLAEEHPKPFEVALVKYLRGATRRFGSNLKVSPLAADLEMLDEAFDVLRNPNINYVTAALSLYLDSAAAGLADSLRSDRYEAVISELRSNIATNPGRYANDVGRVATNMLLGKLYSLTDRSRAAEHFRLVRELDSNHFVEHFYIDLGASTYFSTEHLKDSEASNRTARVQHSITPLESTPHTVDSAFVISVDPRFFRIYAPTFLYYAQQLPDIDYALVICGTEADAQEAMRHGREFSRSLNALNSSGADANVRYYHAPVPDFVAERKSFYASARFYAIESLLRKYDHLYLLDADMTAVADPRPYLKQISSLPFGVVQTPGFTGLSPWRRNMAGNVTVSREALESPILSDLQDYLSYSLEAKNSWMLDQNALTYAVERNPGVTEDLSRFHRPFSQNEFRSTWEENYTG